MTIGGHQPSSPDVMREQRLQRNLKIVVGGLGVLILLGLGAVMARVAGLASQWGKNTVPMEKSVITAPGGGTLALEIPQGAKVVSVSLSGNRLAVQHEGPAGTGIAIIDIGTGRRLIDVKPIESVPRN
jgi:hypothetical protein